ncbi:leucine-rich repeat protein [Acetobacterium paludosum]|uniref:Leucine-rich repeat protein n=1 Tax=Acetobacterium paludosum TaxID=52693 RepID=A0A923KS09_9FIRM|nr:leucine-rich repeat protein [Acetobacterium paludosum]MBC3887857.1 leucine-rich repeat protein [Acetobacterium paludosum]
MKRIVFCLFMLGCLFPFQSVFAADTQDPTSFTVLSRGHIQDVGDFPTDGSWVSSPNRIGTVGESKRIEGFEIKPGDTLPEGIQIRYNVHVQNIGWLYDENDFTTWAKDGDYAGTRGKGLRIEAIKIVLTDAAGKEISGYHIKYRGHVQNVGDTPADSSQWIQDGNQLGTVGSSLRLEALTLEITKDAVQGKSYDTAGNYGPASGTETVTGDATIAADGVILQNLVIDGNLTISEAVGSGTVTLNNVTVKGDTFVRGGGVNSIKINGGEYSRIVMQKTASGAVRIVAIDVKGLPFFVSEAAAGETIILEGAFDSVTVNAPNMTVTTQGDTTTIGKMTVGTEAAGSAITLNAGTTVTDLVLDAKTAVKGQGAVAKAEVKADGVTFEQAPTQQTIAPEVTVPPVVTPAVSPVTPPTPGGGGGYTPPAAISVTGVSLDQTTLALIVGDSGKLTATVAPANAANQAVTWSSDKTAVATVDSAGNVKAVAAGTAVITVTTNDGSKTAASTITVTTIPVIGVSLDADASVGLNKTTTLTATVAPANATNKNLTWSTSDAEVATVDASGKVTGVKEGTATITGTTDDGKFTDQCEVTVTYSFNVNIGTDGNGTITGMNGYASSIEIPAVIDGVPITAIGDNAFDETGLTDLTVPNTVTSIGQSAFANCKYLTTIGLPTGLASLSEKMFKNCTSLTTITLPASVKSIGANAFYNCQKLTGIVIPEGVTAIPEGTFDSCWALASVTLPSHLTTIDTNGFKTCKALKTLTLPASLAKIGQEAFSGAGTVDDTQGINSTLVMTFEGNAPTLFAGTGTGSFFATGTTFQYYAGCTGFDVSPWNKAGEDKLKMLDVRTITSLTIKGVTIPFNGVQPVDVITADPQYTGTVIWHKLNDAAEFKDQFDGTKDYTAAITLKPANGYTATGVSFTVEGASATSPATINPDGTVTITAAFPVLEQFNIDAATGVITAYSGPGGNVTIPDQVTPVTGIGSYVFEGNDTLTGITLPATVTSIGKAAFYNCTALTTVTIPAGVESIGAAAFKIDTGTLPTARAFTFRGNAPTAIANDAIPVSDATATPATTTTIRYYSDKTGFEAAKWSGYTMSPILAAPTVQVASQDTNTLNWSPVEGETGYEVHYDVYYGTATDNITTLKGNTTNTNYKLNDLIPEQTYYFTVTATDSFGSSLPSTSITVKKSTAP